MPDIFTSSQKEFKTNVLSAFVRCPKKVHFEIQDSEEKIVLMLRRHPITNIPWMLQTMLMAILPPIILFFVPLTDVPANFKFIGITCWYFLVFAFAFEKFLSWLFDVNIITDERIVDINFPSILRKEINEAATEDIVEINTTTSGFIGTLFNFGDVLIQTPGEQERVCFNDVPDTAKVAEIINEQRIEEKQEKLEGRVR